MRCTFTALIYWCGAFDHTGCVHPQSRQGNKITRAGQSRAAQRSAEREPPQDLANTYTHTRDFVLYDISNKSSEGYFRGGSTTRNLIYTYLSSGQESLSLAAHWQRYNNEGYSYTKPLAT